MPTDKEIEAAAFQIHAEMGCTITAARICAERALAAAEQVRASESKPNHGTDPTWPGPMAGED
jgi:4'-phosphopantetheinyl transferase EntD